MEQEINNVTLIITFIKAAFEIKNMPFSKEEEKELILKTAKLLGIEDQVLKELEQKPSPNTSQE